MTIPETIIQLTKIVGVIAFILLQLQMIKLLRTIADLLMTGNIVL